MDQRILVDMDGVLADVYTQFITFEYERSGKQIVLDEIYGKLEEFAFPSFKEDVNKPGFFRTVPPIENCIEGLNYLNNKYTVLIVSSATEFTNSLNDKRAWLSEYFPFISWKQMIFCGSKENIQGDIMIDDHPKNLRLFPGRKILFTQPHNVYTHGFNFERVNDWIKIMNIL
ncbi:MULTISPECIES: 5' nucleotidase, NT5C type [unclassified Dysgonomonas]|uniref:5' nucleotidase, NT5C type n=1 Tax=unclassified Dysgonomonas TaxID=2630389 RepID=UPI0025BA8A37|nr:MULTISPECIES: 5'(3')-deoxyribonucleotidase [unclassified Dysgonomonas]